MARPTKYHDGLADKADEYLAEKEKCIISSSGRTIHGLPMLNEFAAYIDVNVDTLQEWDKRHPKFSVALEKIRLAQQKKLVEYGLSKEFDSSLVKLLLSHNHKIRETTEQQNVQMTYAQWCEQQGIK